MNTRPPNPRSPVTEVPLLEASAARDRASNLDLRPAALPDPYTGRHPLLLLLALNRPPGQVEITNFGAIHWYHESTP